VEDFVRGGQFSYSEMENAPYQPEPAPVETLPKVALVRKKSPAMQVVVSDARYLLDFLQ